MILSPKEVEKILALLWMSLNKDDQFAKMKLLPEELEKIIPPLGATFKETDPIVKIRFFDPYGSWSWYVIEGSRHKEGVATILDDKEYHSDMIFYGLVKGFEDELGDFSLAELESIKTSWGTPRIERDIIFEHMPLSEVVKKYN